MPFLTREHYDFADLSAAFPVDTHREQQPFRAGAEYEFSNSSLSRIELVAFALARLQNEPVEVAKTIKDYFDNFPGHALAFLGRTARYTGIISRCRHLIGIDSQIFDLIAELADVANKNRMPAI